MHCLQWHVYLPSDEKPRVTLTQYPEYTVMFPEESVFFSCHIIVSSGWEYQWYKDGAQLSQYGNSHNISFVGTKDTGSYTCQVKRGRDMVFKSDHSQAVRLKVEGTFFCPPIHVCSQSALLGPKKEAKIKSFNQF